MPWRVSMPSPASAPLPRPSPFGPAPKIPLLLLLLLHVWVEATWRVSIPRCHCKATSEPAVPVHDSVGISHISCSSSSGSVRTLGSGTGEHTGERVRR